MKPKIQIILCIVLLLALAVPAFSFAPKLPPAPAALGHGTVLRWGTASQAKDIPIVQYDIPLSSICIGPGLYDWNRVDTALADAKKYGKRAAVAFWDHSYQADGDSIDGTGLPLCWQCKYINSIYSFGQIVYPVRWDPAYQQYMREFVKAFAAKYPDGTFEYVLITETALPFQKELQPLWAGFGYSPAVYATSIENLVSIWRAGLPKTTILLGLNRITGADDDAKWIDRIATYCVSKKVGFLNPGLRMWDNKEQKYIWPIFRQYQDVVKIAVVINGRALAQGGTLPDVVQRGLDLVPGLDYLAFPQPWQKNPNYPAALKLANGKI